MKTPEEQAGATNGKDDTEGLVVHSEMSEDIDQPAGSKGAGRSQQHVCEGSGALGRGEALPKQAHPTANYDRNPGVHFLAYYDESTKH
ncbi:MAG TPA: hypothetical protein VKB77_01350 [Terriglobales bacterium]|nr:hypothetical protein [Terriglobales bacterium]